MISRLIGEPIADHALYHFGGPLFVVHALCDAIIITEVEFRKVAMQVLLIAVLINAFHPALEDRKVVLKDIGMAIAASPSIAGMINGPVLRELLADPLVRGRWTTVMYRFYERGQIVKERRDGMRVWRKS